MTGAPPVAGGFATYAGADSPFNKIVGTGFDGLPTDDELAHLETQYDTHASPAGFEISTLADPAIFELLTARGYLLVGFEDVLVPASTRVPVRTSPRSTANRPGPAASTSPDPSPS